jgi:hypothetical protein
LVRAGLVHAQFESIHPFFDGNGRVGRLLITFMLCAEEVLREPVLYLSLFLKTHRRLYYDRLNGTRGEQGWTAWLDFFLQGVRDTANQAARTASSIDKLFRKDKEKIELFGPWSSLGIINLPLRSSQSALLDSVGCTGDEGQLSDCLGGRHALGRSRHPPGSQREASRAPVCLREIPRCSQSRVLNCRNSGILDDDVRLSSEKYCEHATAFDE